MKFPTCSVNKKLLPLKAHYFLFLGAQAAVIPYFAAVGRQNGIPETTVAYTFGFVPLAAIACKSLCGYIVDRTQNVTVVLLTLQALLLVSDGVVFFSGSIHTNTLRSEGILQCSEENVTLLDPFTTCSLSPPPQCKRLCRESKENSSTSKLGASLSIGNVSDVCSVLSYWNHSVSSDDDNCELTCACYESSTNKSNLWLYTVFLALAWMTGASVFVISDAAVCDALGDNASAFGRQRLWGTISWGICCPFVGIIIDAANRATEGRSGFTPSFYVFAVLLLMDMVLLYRMPRLRMCKQSPTFFRDVAMVFKGAEMPVFTFWTCAFGVFFGIFVAYNTWFLEDVGASKLNVGLTYTVMTLLVELPLLFVSKGILERIGYFPSYSLAFAAYAVKYFGYSFLQNPWHALVIELVGGAAFPLAFAAMTVFAKETAPQGTAASVLCVLNAGVEGVGTVVGNVVGGVSFGKNGGRLTFRYIGLASFACAVLCTLSHVVIRRRRPKTSIVPQAMASVMPYQAAVGRRGGIPEATIAYILGFIPLLAILAKPVCGFIVDKTQNVKLVLIGLNALACVSNGVVFLSHGTPFEGPNVKGRLACPEGNLTLETASFNCMASLLECNVSCRHDKSIAASIKTEPQLTLADAYSVCSSLWNGTTSRDEDICEMNCPCYTGSEVPPNLGLYVVFLSLAAVAMTALVISDAAICEILGENSHTFGQQRLWGTIGFGVCSPVVGVFIDELNKATDGRSGYSPCFYVFAALMMTDITLLFFIPPLRMSKVSSNFFKDLATVFRRLEMTVFALWTCLLGALLGITLSYNTWFLEDIGASKMIVGFNGALMAVLIELPLLFVSGFILEKIGYFPCYCLAFVALGTKYVGYSYLYEPWFSLLIEIAGGAAFPLTIASMTVFAKVTARGGTAASVLCILNSTFDGI
ncbi:hypothetical protein HPB47_020290, partial [Ixodes persulcatus]